MLKRRRFAILMVQVIRPKIKVAPIFFTVITCLCHPIVQAQQEEQIDSLLAMHFYAEALGIINAVPTSTHTNSIEDARAFIDRLQAATSLPDSLIDTRLLNASSLSKDYEVENAGARAASKYHDFLTSYASKDIHSAYEDYLLAQYFRTEHVKRERARMRNNIAMTFDYVRKEEFEKAADLLETFYNEKRTSAFITLEDSLRYTYDWLQPQIELGRAKHELVLSRTPITRILYVTIGGGLNPSVKLDKEQLLLREFETEEYTVFNYSGNSINTIAPFYCIEGGYFFSSHTSIGISYARSTNTIRNTFSANSGTGSQVTGQTSISYRAKVEYARADVFMKHRLTDKTGPRPFLTAGLGIATSKLSPLEDSGADHILYVKPVKYEGFRLLLGGGAEYVFSEDWPFVLSGNGLMFLNSGNSDILNRVNFEIYVQLGAIL